MSGVDWTRWTVILLKPDCLRRDLVEEVLAFCAREVAVSAVRTVTVREDQILAHYDDMLAPSVSEELGLDVRAELRRIFAGNHVVVALGYGQDAAARIRARLGHTAPSLAASSTLRGRFGIDSLAKARAEGRLIDNLIHTSDEAAVVARDFSIWYGPGHRHLLTVRDDRSAP